MREHSPVTLPAGLYRDPALFEAERKAIFARSWLLIAHESQMRVPGATVAMTVAGFRLMAVRQEDGTIKAFHNVCRHRAGPLAPEGLSRCDGRIVCAYHGWRYALDGRLAAARDFGPAEDFDPRGYGLFPLASEIWRGFVFVNADVNAAPLLDAIAPLERRARALDIERFAVPRMTSHDIACNWKTYTENFLEGYHIGAVHPTLSASLATPYTAEVDPPAQFYSAEPHKGAAVAGLWGWVWPSLGVNVYADGILMERISPVDLKRTRLDYLWLFAEDAGDNAVAAQIEASAVTTREDIWICEEVQKNLDAGIYETGRLSPRHERGVAWFQSEVARRIAETAR